MKFPSMAEKNITERMKSCYSISAKQLFNQKRKKKERLCKFLQTYCSPRYARCYINISGIRISKATSGTDKILENTIIQLSIERDLDLNLDSDLVKHHFFQSKKESRSICKNCFLQGPVSRKGSSACGTSGP